MEVVQSIRRMSAAVTVVLWVSSGIAAAQSTACDLDKNGSTNVVDVTQAVNMALGSQSCTASVEGPNTCTVVTVQRIVNAALGQPCVTYNSSTHSVSLNWLASPSSGVDGYNIYRRVGTSGTFTKINSTPIKGTTYTDSSVSLNTTYQYAATSVDVNGNESALSAAATAVIPAT
jgi:hypothetical protein